MPEPESELTFDEYQMRAGETAVYPGSGDTLGLLYTALGLAGEAGEIANKVKKVLRDAGGTVTDKAREEIAHELGDILWYTAMLADELGAELGAMAEANLRKLADRAQRGVISGSGDNR